MIRHLMFATALLVAPQALADPSPSGLVGDTHPHNHHHVAQKKTVARNAAAKDADAQAAKTPPKVSNQALTILPP